MNTTLAAKTQTPTSMLHVQPSTNWVDLASARFVEGYVQPASETDAGYLDYLEYMFDGTHSTTARDAFLACSLASLGNTSEMTELQVKSKVHYGRALQGLQTALNDASTAATDGTLLTVIILQTYEVGY
jgi:hypothetical protein